MEAPPRIPDDLDSLPTHGVRDYIERVARAHDILYRRTRLDDWSEAVTRAAGDDIQLDATEKLLVALAKRKLFTARQASRLLTNYMSEAKDVRPLPGL